MSLGNNVQTASGTSIDTITLSSYTVPVGSNKILFAQSGNEINATQTGNTTGVTFDGTNNFSEQVSHNRPDQARGEVWTWNAGGSTDTGDIVWTLAAEAERLRVCAHTGIDLAQQNAEATEVHDDVTENPIQTTVTTITDNAEIVDSYGDNNGNTISVSEGASGQTEMAQIDLSGMGGFSEMTGGTAGAHTLGWNSDGNQQVHVVAAFEVAAAGGGTLDVDLSDAVTVTENITVLLPVLLPSVSDTITIAEAIIVRAHLNAVVNDEVTVAEDVTVRAHLNMNVSESVSVDEDVTVLLPALTPSVFDAISVAEDVTVVLVDKLHEIDVADTVSVSESVTVLLPLLLPNVNDEVSVAEEVTVRAHVNLDVSESVTVEESTSVLLPFLGIEVEETVTVSEGVTVEFAVDVRELDLADTVSVSEGVSVVLVTGGTFRRNLLTMGVGA